MKGLIRPTFILAGLAFVLAVFISRECVAQQKAYTMNYADYFPAPHKQAILVDQWCK